MDVLILAPKDALGVMDPGVSQYEFHGAGGLISWPRDFHAHLGPVGAWNFFLRLGYRPRWITWSALAAEKPAENLLVVSSLGRWTSTQVTALQQWTRNGGTLLAAGVSPHWFEFWGFDAERASFQTIGRPEGALGVQYCKEGDASVWAPAEQPYLRPGWEELPAGVKPYGRLLLILGERSSPKRALKTDLGVPVLWQNGKAFYLNGNPFAGFQAWLQGQSDLSSWLGWRHRLFWLDQWVADLQKLLLDAGILSLVRPKQLEGFSRISIVFRHDVDASKDRTYLEVEEKSHVPATYAILKDLHTRFWTRALKASSTAESALHYNTIQNDLFSQIARRFQKRTNTYHPARRQIAGKGILRQVGWARRQGIGVQTLHRHGPFLIYPEWIDAMDHVFSQNPDISGSSSLFRSRLLRYGQEDLANGDGALPPLSEVQFPLWFPFKLAHAGYQGRPLRGWESAHVMEVAPEAFMEMIEQTEELDLPYFVFTLNFHPAHALRPTFAPGGCIAWFKKILEFIQEQRYDIFTLRGVYEKLNHIFHADYDRAG
jgi:hypothetical protein